jgi:hypothetical protein
MFRQLFISLLTVIAVPALARTPNTGTATHAIPAVANIDPPRTVQFQVRYVF